MNKLSPSEITSQQSELSHWILNAKTELERKFVFPGFLQALSFLNAVGWLAEAAGHHPDVQLNYNRLTLTLITHDKGGLTQADFDLALQINQLPGAPL